MFQKWGRLSAPVDPKVNFDIYTVMSSMTKNGKVPTFAEAEAEYERRLQEERANG